MTDQLKESRYRPLIGLSAVGFWGHLAMLALGIAVITTVGPPPASAEEAFARFGTGRIGTLLADDTYNMLLIVFYALSFPGLFFVLKDHRFTAAFLAVVVVTVTALLVPLGNTAFSMMHLSDIYHESEDPVLRERLLAAGEALIAGNMWNSSAGYAAGIFLQGGGILICAAMAGHRDFRKITIITGIVGNGIDLLQHLIHPFQPETADVMKMVMEPFYIAWFITAALDMGRLYRRTSGS